VARGFSHVSRINWPYAVISRDNREEALYSEILFVLHCRILFPNSHLGALFVRPTWAGLNLKTCAPATAMTQIQYQDLVNCAVTATGQSQLFTFSAQAVTPLSDSSCYPRQSSNNCGLLSSNSSKRHSS